MRFGARQQIPDIAVDFRHFVGRPQPLLQTASSSALISPNLRFDLGSINRVNCVWVVAPEESKISSLRTLVDSENRSMGAVRFSAAPCH